MKLQSRKMMGILAIVLALLVLGAVLRFVPIPVSYPFAGPGYDPQKGILAEGEEFIVGLSHVIIDKSSGSDQQTFWKHVQAVGDTMGKHPGLVGASRRTLLFGQREAWTMSVWTDEASLKAFVRSEIHREAMQQGMPAVAQARFARVSMHRGQLPLTWSRAIEILETQGRDY